jgi:spore maturation protein CgeB
MTRRLDIVIFGLSLSSSWGNGHATTWRALIRGLNEAGHRVTFMERDVEWYRNNRDLARADFCQLRFYNDLRDVGAMAGRIAKADAVIIGSYVPEGARLIDLVAGMRPAFLGFYDIDTPVTLAMLSSGEEAHLRKDQVPLFDAYLSFSGGPSLKRLEREFGARRAVALHCAVDPRLYFPQEVPMRWDLGYLGTYSDDRQPALERLLIEPARMLPNMRFVVAGSSYPPGIRWPANVERIEHLDPSRHRAFYAAQRFTLNLTRAHMIAAGWSPSVRIFEAAACGTAIISDRWDGLSSLLPDGKAIIIADSSADVADALTRIGDDERAAIAANARKRVLARHTGSHRAIQLARLMVDCLNDTGSRRTDRGRGTGRMAQQPA